MRGSFLSTDSLANAKPFMPWVRVVGIVCQAVVLGCIRWLLLK